MSDTDTLAGGRRPPREDIRLLVEMAKDWTDPVVVRDAPDRVPYVIQQLIDAVLALAPRPPHEEQRALSDRLKLHAYELVNGGANVSQLQADLNTAAALLAASCPPPQEPK